MSVRHKLVNKAIRRLFADSYAELLAKLHTAGA